MALQLQFKPHASGVSFSLFVSSLLGKQTCLPLANWEQQKLGKLLSSVDLLKRLHEEQGGELQVDSLVLTHNTIATLCQSEAYMLGLPPVTPLGLSLQSLGNIAQNNFAIEFYWLTSQGKKAMGVVRQGSMLQYQGSWQRLPTTLYALCEAIEAHNALPPEATDERHRHLAHITRALPDEAQTQVYKDGFLKNLRVYHAAALSLRLNTTKGEFDFDPLLFGQSRAEQVSLIDDEDPNSNSVKDYLPTESEALLPLKYQNTFIQHYNHTYHLTRPSYVLGDNRYVFLEPMLQKALEIVRHNRQADPQTRKEFIRTPQRFFKEELGEFFDEHALESMFVATQEYSERVTGLGLWVKKTLPWVVHAGNTWIPEAYGVQADKQVTIISHNSIAIENIKKLRKAMQHGKEYVVISGALPDASSLNSQNLQDEVDYVEQVTVPATEETLKILISIERILREKEFPETTVDSFPNDLEANEDAARDPFFINVADNFESAEYCKFKRHLNIPHDFNLPPKLKTTLKQHQHEAFTWLVRMWSGGYSGALLADDMGLGKTLSCLTFLAWVQQQRKALGKHQAPILIVAPTTLMGNWQNEAAIHLHDAGLGECIVARGAQLKLLRHSHCAMGRDIDDGTSRLDNEKLRNADWILTTYETLRDYHHSFASVPLAVVVYDEMQKAKNPTSQISNALRTLNAEFSLGLTGTPIENSLTDLWAIMDVLLPGFLGELKQFNVCYSTDSQLKELKIKLEGEPNVHKDFKPMLRRMKSDTLEGLPLKREHIYPTPMPKYQADAYENALCEPMQPLKLLHALRMISLHPAKPDEITLAEYLSFSARFITTLELLDSIQAQNEKVLVFLEARDHQPILAKIIQKRYGLAKLPVIINGQTPAMSRQKYVTTFQEANQGFEVMILSPKAAGIGITLTAANHVIHLSRWWNPAVEDQCTDRVYRLGQWRDVHVYFPLAVHDLPHLKESSFDLQLHHLLERKRTLSREALIPVETGEEAKELYDGIKKQLQLNSQNNYN